MKQNLNKSRGYLKTKQNYHFHTESPSLHCLKWISSVLFAWLLYNCGLDVSVSLASFFLPFLFLTRWTRWLIGTKEKENIFDHPRAFNLVVLYLQLLHTSEIPGKREKDEGRKFKQPNSWNTNARTIRDLLVRLCCHCIHKEIHEGNRDTKNLGTAGNVVSVRS